MVSRLPVSQLLAVQIRYASLLRMLLNMTIEKERTYNIWRSMRQRCSNPNNDHYHQYGGRGITVCERWQNSYDDFLADMGEAPDGLTLERKDTNGNYEPSNCIWDTHRNQMLNRRFFTRSTDNPTPYLTKYEYGYKLQVTICKNHRWKTSRRTLAEAEELRDICIFERDFLKSRGLSYD